MLDIHIENIGDLAIIECEGRIVRSEAALKLRAAVISECDARIVVIDLSEVSAVEAGGLGMLMYLQRWARDHEIRFKLFNPRQSVRYQLEHTGSMWGFEIATLDEMMALLASAENHYSQVA
jgi:anti-anti-sigma regulatory factor